MPHLVLEFSSNVIEKNNLQGLFLESHSILAKMLPTKIDSCKSRAIECDTYCVGDGDGQSNNAFVHVTLKILTGRSFDTLKSVGDRLMETLKNYFAESAKQLNLQITLEIIELEKTYFY